MGIDGRIYPVSAIPKPAKKGELGFMDVWYPVQVKQRDKAGRPDIDQFETAMRRAERKLGYFVAFDFTPDARFEVDRFQRKEGREIRLRAVREILDEEIKKKPEYDSKVDWLSARWVFGRQHDRRRAIRDCDL
jgi:hypothetical protein